MPGYSLFELLVVLALVAFAAMLTPPAVNALRPELQTEKTAGEMAGALRLARSRAVTEGEAVRLTVRLEQNRLRFDETGQPIAAGRRAGWIAAPRGVIVTVNDRRLADANNAAGGDYGIIFHPDGSASGLDIRLAGKRAIWRVTTSLNGKTSVTEEPA